MQTRCQQPRESKQQQQQQQRKKQRCLLCSKQSGIRGSGAEDYEQMDSASETGRLSQSDPSSAAKQAVLR